MTQTALVDGGIAKRAVAWGRSLDFRSRGERPYLKSLAAVGIVTAVMLPLRDHVSVIDVALVYLMVVLGLALAAGSGPASIMAIVEFAVLNFLFIPPLYTFSIDDTDHILALVVFLGVAIVTGQLAARLQARTDLAERERRRAEMLFELNAALIGDVTLDAILARIVERVVAVYGARRARILVHGDDDELVIGAAYPIGTRPEELDRDARAMATWAIEHRVPAGLGGARRRIRLPHGVANPPAPRTPREEETIFLPVATRERVVGALEIAGRPGGGTFNLDDEQLLGTFASQAALALERARLAGEAARAAVLAQSDELKSALLSAVSHDLRTPLAAIKASATSLMDTSVDWDDASRREFLEAIDEETDRLTLMVGNLLDLSRIQAGALMPDKDWYDLGELIEDVIRRLGPRAASHPITTTLDPHLPAVRFDYVEMTQVVTNLLENALKYTPPGTSITVQTRAKGRNAVVEVNDQGPGISNRTQAKIFDTFVRGESTDAVQGSGLGLAICKGLVEAHGGRIWVDSRPGVGASFRFTLPLEGAPPNGA